MKFVLWLSMIATLMLSGCEREMPTEPEKNPSPSLSLLEIPDQITFNQSYRISTKVADEQGPENVPFVLLSIRAQTSTIPMLVDTLWDDGQAMHHGNGDVIAHDGIFTQILSWAPEDTSRQELTFLFTATDKSGHDSNPLEKTVLSLLNAPPLLTEVSAPTSLPSGFEGEKLITAKVVDENAVSVHFYGTRKDSADDKFEGELFDNGENGDVTPGDNTFSLAITAEFAAAKSGIYTLKFQAEDALGDTSKAIVLEIDVENTTPNIANITCPADTLLRPSSGTKPVLVTLDVSDEQGLGDIQFVGFMSLKPNSKYANKGQPIPMTDNGRDLDLNRWQQQYWGDETEGDGIYSISAILVDTTMVGDYVWTFFAKDWVGNVSDSLKKVITIQ